MQDFQQQLAQWGPQSTYDPPALQDAQRYTRRLAESHYENFPVVSWLLPVELHQPFFNVYAYCRWADDLGDETGDPQQSLQLLDWWESELDRCYQGHPRHPVFVALKPTLDEFQIPAQPFRNLLSAFRQDQSVFQYATFDELRKYCRRSADPVGQLVLFLCRSHRAETVELSDSICTGLQLANFWQDVARDADIGRCYLPREDRLRFGYSDSDLTARVTNPAFLNLMQFEVQRARDFLERGLALPMLLPRNVRLDIDLFARGGLKILEKIEQQDFRVWERRPKVTKWDACKLLLSSWWRSKWHGG